MVRGFKNLIGIGMHIKKFTYTKMRIGWVNYFMEGGYENLNPLVLHSLLSLLFLI